MHLDLKTIENAPVAIQPFPYFTAAHTLSGGALTKIGQDFPAIEKPGVFPLADLTYGPQFAQLIEEVNGEPLRKIMERKFGVDLSGKPLMITVRGHCQPKDGRVHTDSKDKFLTCLLYLNDLEWPVDGGCLRLLRDGDNIESTIAEVPPLGGTLVAFRRTDQSWHGHKPYVGRRRYIMFNWLESEAALSRNIMRHRLSALFKKWGWQNDYKRRSA